jgi:hypothetical protein
MLGSLVRMIPRVFTCLIRLHSLFPRVYEAGYEAGDRRCTRGMAMIRFDPDPCDGDRSLIYTEKT